jgi:hypothetical protein
VEQAATVVADQEEDVEGLEGQGLNHEEVGWPRPTWSCFLVSPQTPVVLASRSGPA